MPSVLLDGTGQPAPESIPLRAGALSMYYEAGTLRSIRLGDHEIVRGIYAAVRDQNWGTVPATLTVTKLDVGDSRFDIAFTSDHGLFVWNGTISGAEDGTVQFTFDGEARQAFKRNRVGFCVLHPMEVAGAACAIEHTDGSTEQGAFPQSISPHQPYFDIRAITHEVVPGIRAEVRMEGDTFEMEDQRNWIDASYKTYCTPLGLPFPVALEAGAKVQQCITLRLLGQADSVNVTDSAPVLRVDAARGVQLPAIGLCAASHGEPLTAREVERLKALNLAHLRFDLRASGDFVAQLQQAVEQASAIGCALELAVHLGQDTEADLARLRAAVDAVIVPLQAQTAIVARWLIFREGEIATQRATVEAARKALESYGAPIGAGTDAFFTELNRNRPPADLLDVVAYSINPQVHAFDNTSLVETLSAQAVTVESARTFSGSAKIAVSPITFKMRWNPNATAPDPEPPPGVLPRAVDPRQMSLFGAVWTLGSLKSLALGGADSLTYYETTGWLGVMERESGSPLPDKFPSFAGGVFPLYHVLAAVGAFAGGEVLSVTSSTPLRFDALALRKGGALRVLVANYTPDAQQVALEGLEGRFALKSLDETTAAAAMREPEAFGAAAGTPVEGSGLCLDLPPYAVVILDRMS